ncbi:hypothetical protein NDU88_005019 [Pleurodeles waltl]|uniref:Uncharacterized protein n=1 Tax=Pleurodeles waltl TaxID=8319 RepID=A0AAV7SKJ6_PLEWA|nr:hypothetical protein NDU88_005019 [Pleurodeles waltl]
MAQKPPAGRSDRLVVWARRHWYRSGACEAGDWSPVKELGAAGAARRGRSRPPPGEQGAVAGSVETGARAAKKQCGWAQTVRAWRFLVLRPL